MKTTIVTLSIALVLGMNIGMANSDDVPLSYKPSIRQIIIKSAIVYNVKPEILVAVAKCESNLNNDSIGDHGKAKGIFQYHEQTFNSFSELIGKKLNYDSADDQAELTSFIFAHYPQYRNQWTCYRHLYMR